MTRWPGPLGKRPLAPALLLVVLLAACGGGGGGDGPAAPAEVPVVLGQAGPGDPDAYVPLAVGNFWHFSGSATGSFGSVVDNWVTVSGTQTVDGRLAWVLRESNPGGDGQAVRQSVVKDANGLAVVAADPADDAFARGLVPYWELRFPLATASQFAQLERTQLDLGQDLDGDGRTEKVAVRSTVRVVGKEAVTVPAGSFGDALRVDRSATLSITLSRDGRVVQATENASAWLVSHLGWVRRTQSLTVDGAASTLDEQLDAYQVDGAQAGAVFPSTGGLNGNLTAGQPMNVAWPGQPAGRYTVVLSGVRGATTLSVAGGVCRSGLAAPGRSAPTDCSVTLDVAGPVLARVQAAADTGFVMWLVPTPTVSNPVDESKALNGNVNITGQVGPRGTSTYVVGGLAPFSYGVTLFGLDQDADLHLYADDTFSTELNCTLRSVGDVLPSPEDCVTSPNGGKLYIRITAGELNSVGAGFQLVVGAARP